MNYEVFRQTFEGRTLISTNDILKRFPEFDTHRLTEWQEKGYPIWEYRTVDANGMAEDKQKSNLDVRNLNEWKSTGVIQGSKLISLS